MLALDLWRTRPYSASHSIDRLFDDLFTPVSNGGSSTSSPVQSVPVNVWDTGESFHAAVLAPGLDEESINVTLHEEVLTIEGELRVVAPEGAKAVWGEFGPSKFRRSLRLGMPVDGDKVEAMYRNGVLLVTMPKAEHAKPRRITVQADPAKA
jgi:HSP20 family protein